MADEVAVHACDMLWTDSADAQNVHVPLGGTVAVFTPPRSAMRGGKNRCTPILLVSGCRRFQLGDVAGPA